MDRFASFAQQNKLTEVADELQRLLKPVVPPPAFREHLRDNLQMAAEHRLAHRAPGSHSDRHNNAAWSWIIGAALLGAVIGFLAMQFRARRRRITAR